MHPFRHSICLALCSMKETYGLPTGLVCAWVCFIWLWGATAFCADNERTLLEQVQQLQRQNELLQQQMQQQQGIIESLSRKVSGLESAGQAHSGEGRSGDPGKQESYLAAKPGNLLGLGKLHLSGEGGLAFFQSQSAGQFPKAQFR